jgi:hypothetical protein
MASTPRPPRHEDALPEAISAPVPAAPQAPGAPAIAAAAPARPAPFLPPAQQVAPFAVALSLGPEQSLTLTLDPVELGRVEVQIDRQGGEATIRISAERPETLAMLTRDQRELERALADLGPDAPTLSFGGERRGRQHEPAPHQPRGGTARPAALPPPVAATPARGLLDLAL